MAEDWQKSSIVVNSRQQSSTVVNSRQTIGSFSWRRRRGESLRAIFIRNSYFMDQFNANEKMK